MSGSVVTFSSSNGEESNSAIDDGGVESVNDDDATCLEEGEEVPTAETSAETEEEQGGRGNDSAGTLESEQDTTSRVDDTQERRSSSFSFRRTIEQQANIPENELPMAQPISRQKQRREKQRSAETNPPSPLFVEVANSIPQLIENATPLPNEKAEERRENCWYRSKGRIVGFAILFIIVLVGVITVADRATGKSGDGASTQPIATEDDLGDHNNEKHVNSNSSLEPTIVPTTARPSPVPTAAPSPIPTAQIVVESSREERLYRIISNLTDPQLLRNETNLATGEIHPQYQAWQWMSWEDLTGVGDIGSALDNARVVQRFVVATCLVSLLGREVLDSFWMVDAPNTHECDFISAATNFDITGIKCDLIKVRGGEVMMRQVTAFGFATAMALRGTIPREIQYLTELYLIDFDLNMLFGTLPTELGMLKQLRFLYMGHNRLSGTIPSELGRLRKLKHLHLQNNRLSGTLPRSLSKLTGLQQFDLSMNAKIEGTLPRSFTNLQNVDVLLHRTAMTGSFQPLCPNRNNTKIRTSGEESTILSDCLDGSEVTECDCCTGCYSDEMPLERVNATDEFPPFDENPCKFSNDFIWVELEIMAQLDGLSMEWEIGHFNETLNELFLAGYGWGYRPYYRYREHLCLPRMPNRCYELHVYAILYRESPSWVELRADGKLLWRGLRVKRFAFGDGCSGKPVRF